MCDNPCLVMGLLPKTRVFSAATAVSIRLQGKAGNNTRSGTSLDLQTLELALTLKLTHTLYTVCKGVFCASLIAVVRTTILRK